MERKLHVHMIQHEDYVDPGEYAAWVKRHGCAVSITRIWEHEEFPPIEELPDLLVVLGGPQCPATTKEECAYFDAAAEKALIRRCADAGRAVVGVCLGSQLVGEAMGAEYHHSPEKEVGPALLTLTEEGRKDPFLRHFPDTFLAGEWHNDMPGLTPDCAVLAKSEGCPRQIVRYRRWVYGLQCHMEFTHEITVALIHHLAHELAYEGRFIWSEEDLLAFDFDPMNRLLSGFLDALTEDYLREKERR